jgi:hypothetical protein
MSNLINKSTQPTEKQIAKWKQEHRQLFEIEVDGHKAYLRKPTRQELSASLGMAQTDPLGFAEQLLNSCWLGGDEALREDDDLFLAVQPLLSQMIEIKAGQLKKI